MKGRWLETLEDLKYTMRLNRSDFTRLLFPGATEEYAGGKWFLFSTDPLRFLWSCSHDKIQILVDYVIEQSGGRQ